MRTECANALTHEKDTHFEDFVRLCEERHVTPQGECILRALQMAAAAGLVAPSFTSQEGDGNVLGWIGFSVNPKHSNEFRQRIRSMFHDAPDETINVAFRRCGFVAASRWEKAWKGLEAFVCRET